MKDHDEPADVALLVVQQLQEIDRLLRSPAGKHGIDAALHRELRYPISSVRQRFPDLWNSVASDPAQAPLL